MELFHVIDDGAVILRRKGLFRQAKVYRRGEDVYAGVGGGFVKLAKGGGTSLPDVSWIELSAEGVAPGGRIGGPKFSEGAGAVRIAAE